MFISMFSISVWQTVYGFSGDELVTAMVMNIIIWRNFRNEVMEKIHPLIQI